MYPRVTSTSLSPLRFFVVCAALLLGAVQEGHGQRVYANNEQHNYTSLLASISNPAYAVNTDTLLYSTLNVTLGLVGLVSAQQNLQFNTPVVKPSPNSPIIIKFSTPGSLLDLLGGLSVQRTNNSNSLVVPPAYGGTSLLELLNLLGGGSIATLVIPPTGSQFDGVRLTINTTLGVARQANFYYAFYITPPELQSDEIILCEGQSGEAIISNFHIENGTPYTYRLFSAETGGVEVAVSTNADTFIIPTNTPPGSYWLEARENDIYPSARTKITVSVNPKPPAPTLNIHPNSQH